MCNTWQHPSDVDEEFKPALLDKLLGDFAFINITGGEPFLRDDLDDILDIVLTKSKRVVISSNGYFIDKIIQTAKKYPNRIGFRISLEGLPAINDELRGLKDGFDHALRTLLTLRELGEKDIGFGITVSDKNVKDVGMLYQLASTLNMEFATAVVHNSFYFHKCNNQIENPDAVAEEFEKLAIKLLKTNKPKNWFRAYFNMGISNKLKGETRPLPCEAGSDFLFVDPYGQLLACNGSDKPMIMGNLKNESFDSVWYSSEANTIRKQVAECSKNCWMIGSVAPAMKKRLKKPLFWVLLNKLRTIKAGQEEIHLTPVKKKKETPTAKNH